MLLQLFFEFFCQREGVCHRTRESGHNGVLIDFSDFFRSVFRVLAHCYLSVTADANIVRSASAPRADRGCMKLYHFLISLLFYSLYPHLPFEHAYFVVFVCFSSKSSPHCGHLRSVRLYQYGARAGRIIAAAVKDLAGTSASGDNITAAIRTLDTGCLHDRLGILALRIAGAGKKFTKPAGFDGHRPAAQFADLVSDLLRQFHLSMALSATSSSFSNGP